MGISSKKYQKQREFKPAATKASYSKSALPITKVPSLSLELAAKCHNSLDRVSDRKTASLPWLKHRAKVASRTRTLRGSNLGQHPFYASHSLIQTV